MENNKSYRIRTDVGRDKYIHVQLDQNYDTFEILSLRINREGDYITHSADYGVIVGRVLANGGFGVPKARLSIFIPKAENEDTINSILYPYTSTATTDKKGIRYNLLKDRKEDECYQVVGTFPNKRYVLDNDNMIEVFETYYKFTTRTNDSGDYMIFGVPVGSHTIHMDLDLSDCGMLSQRPRDFIYKGYSINQFENANQFKIDTELNSLAQIFSQDESVEVKPYWGDSENAVDIGITRADINVNFKFETTCVFLGSVFTDNDNEGFSRTCNPSKNMGRMDKLVTGTGTIEMIRKKSDGTVEEFQINGTELIDGNGTWCYQIPMNLDYMVTDEYGNLVATDNPERGIATRARVRFRISMGSEKTNTKYFQAKTLVPNNPRTENENDGTFMFGSTTPEHEYRDLFWNNVYTVKSYVPRIQRVRGTSNTYRTRRFSGLKTVNNANSNPFPYNHLRIKFPFMYVMICAIIHFIIKITKWANKTITGIEHVLQWIRGRKVLGIQPFKRLPKIFNSYISLSSRFCEAMEGTYLIPGGPIANSEHGGHEEATYLVGGTYRNILSEEYSENDDFGGMSLRDTPMFETLSDGTIAYADYTIVREDGVYYINVLYYNDGIDFNNQGNKSELYIAVQFTGDTLNSDFKVNKIGFARTSYDLVSEMDADTFNATLAWTNSTGELTLNGETTNPYFSEKAITELAHGLVARGIIDESSMESKGSDTTDSQDVGETSDGDTLCLVGEEEYMMSCIEMQLAEDYDVINFDFYNDWINGSIYMPRWARKVKVRTRSGKKKIKSCTSDAKKSRKLYVGAVGNVYYSDSLIADKPLNYTRKMWKRGSFAKLGKVKGLIYGHKTNLNDTVYYYRPVWFVNGVGKYLMFATDIVLLGSLNDCDMFGTPAIVDTIPSTTYKMPGDLASTNFIDSDGGEAYQGTGCALVSEIPYMKDEELLNVFQTNTGLQVGNETDDNIPYTEDAGISWNYTGPNQTTPESTIDKQMYYSPGGLFLGLACTARKTLTNIKSSYNLIRACEYGVSLSEREEILGDAENNMDMVLVPNGLISKDNIYDNGFRSSFAIMNANRLSTIIDTNTGYYKYKFDYMYPNSFDGGFSEFISGVDDPILGAIYQKLGVDTWRYNGRINVELAEGKTMDDLSAEELYEVQHTYSRAVESTSSDYIKFRYGVTDIAGVLNTKILPGTLKGVKVFPQYENSYYFYFGLNNNTTAMDRFRSDYFATCEVNDEIMDRGGIKTTIGDIDSTDGLKLDSLSLIDVDMPYEIRCMTVDGINIFTENPWAAMYYLRDISGLAPDENGMWNNNVMKAPSIIYPKTINIGTTAVYPFNNGVIYSPTHILLHFNGMDVEVNVDGNTTTCKINEYADFSGETNDTTFTNSDGFVLTFNFTESVDSMNVPNIGIIIDDTITETVIIGNNGAVLNREYNTSELDISSGDFIAQPFYNVSGATLSEKRYEYKDGTIENFIGGCIETTLPIFINGEYAIELSCGDENISYGYNGRDNEYIINWDEYTYRLPVTVSGKWDIRVIHKNGSIVFSGIINVNTIKVSSGYIEANGITINDRYWYQSIGVSSLINYYQFSGEFDTPVNISTTCSDTYAKRVFLGQGEIQSASLPDNIDTKYSFNDGYENRYPTEVGNGYYLNERYSYIPTIGYTNANGVKRNNFEVAYYNKQKAYTQNIVSTILDKCNIGVSNETSIVIDGVDLTQYIGKHLLMILCREDTSFVNAYPVLVSDINKVIVHKQISFTNVYFVNLYDMIEIPIYYYPQGTQIYMVFSMVKMSGDTPINTTQYVDGASNSYITNSIASPGLNTDNIQIKIGEAVIINNNMVNPNDFYNSKFKNQTIEYGEIYENRIPNPMSAELTGETVYYTNDTWDKVKATGKATEIIKNDEGIYKITQYVCEMIDKGIEINIIVYSCR